MARGLSMVLVVLLHAHYAVTAAGAYSVVTDLVGLALFPLRMPLFFMVAGLLATSILARGPDEVMRRRVIHYLYLYVLWWAVYELFHEWLFPGLGPPGVEELFRTPDNLGSALLVSHNFQWFLYALALFFAGALLLRPLPLVWQAAITIALGLAGALEVGDRIGVTVLDRFVHFPWFMLGVLARDRILAMGPRLGRSWTLIGIGVAWVVATATAHKLRLLGHDQYLTNAALALLALPCGIGISAWLANRPPAWSGWLRAIGRNTLPIYVLHTIALRLIVSGVELPPWLPIELWTLTVTAATILLCIAAGWGVQRMPGLFGIPSPRRGTARAGAAN